MTTWRVTLPAGEVRPAKQYLKETLGISGTVWKRIKHSATFPPQRPARQRDAHRSPRWRYIILRHPAAECHRARRPAA